MNSKKDVVVIGAGAAGMMCALEAGKRGRKVLLLDHATHLAEKIRISGGGRCNFTNRYAGPDDFLSHNPHFCRSALARFSPQDFIVLVEKYGVHYHEKKLGQLFCDESSQQIIDLLRKECSVAGVEWRMPCLVQSISLPEPGPDSGGRFLLPRISLRAVPIWTNTSVAVDPELITPSSSSSVTAPSITRM